MLSASMFGRGLTAGALAVALVTVGALAPGRAYGIAGGTPAPDTGYGFVAHVEVGDAARACSGALIDPEWVVTAADCFPITTQPIPAPPVTVTVGRNNPAATTGGQVRTAATVVPDPARNLALIKLSSPVPDVAPVPVASTPPAVGTMLRVAGFGRTGAEWVPDRLHIAAMAVQAVGEQTFDLFGPPASLCRGDAGGPALRQTAGGVELVGIHSASWQAGCHDTPATETRTEAAETRLDNVLGWIRQTIRGGNFVRLPTSAAVLDTRSAIGAPAGARAAGSITSFQVTGVGGIPTTGVTAVLVDVTAVTTSATYLTVFPERAPRDPALSMVNAGANQIISNSAVVNVPASGKLAVHTQGGGVHIVIDVQGYYTTAATGGGFVPVDPTRLVDTRSGLGGGGTAAIPRGGSQTFTLTGGVIPAGASAAFLDMIVTGATAQGWIGAYAAGGVNRSVMDYAVGTTSHGVAVKLGADGRATFTNNSGSPIHLVLTAAGYYTAGPTTGAGLRTITAARKLDTRLVGTRAPIAANGTVDVALGLPSGSAALVNFTIANNTQGGHLRVWPLGATEPSLSLSNYPTPDTGARAGLAVVRAGTDGKIRIRNVSSGTTHLLVDVQGWYVPAGATVPAGSTADVQGAAADPPTQLNGGSIAEDFNHPGAGRILAEHGLRVLRGDGHVVFVTSHRFDEDVQCAADQIQVEKWLAEAPFGVYYCFRTTGAEGFLSLEVPGTFGVRGGSTALRATAQLPEGERTFDVNPAQFVPISPGTGSEPPAAVLVELRLA